MGGLAATPAVEIVVANFLDSLPIIEAMAPDHDLPRIGNAPKEWE